MLTALPNEIVQQVSQIVLYKTFVHGKESIPVDVESFQGKPMQYLQLASGGYSCEYWRLFRVAGKRNKRGRKSQSNVNWFLWQPCIGIPGICPPLAKWSDMTDGTLNIMEVWEMNEVLKEVSKWHQQ